MNKQEARFQTIFGHYLKANKSIQGFFELKQTDKDSVPYSSVRDVQYNSLQAISSPTGLYWKIPDDSMSAKPCDCFYFRNTPAWIVILYRRTNKFYIISIDNFIFYRDNRAKRKSLTEEEAQSIATKEVQL